MYVGAMGSRRTQAARRERLAAAGLTDAELDRLAGPAGLDLGAETAEETALSILAEIVAVRHGRDGGRLSRAGGPIHAVEPVTGAGLGRHRAAAGRRRRPGRWCSPPAPGTRFGPESKLLAKLDGRPVLEWAVPAPCGVAELQRVVVVLGHRAAGRPGPRWTSGAPSRSSASSGPTASRRRCGCGLEALEGLERVIVTLGDQPRMTPRVISLFLDQPGGTRAVYAGRPGHPVVLGPERDRPRPAPWTVTGARVTCFAAAR